MRLKPPRWPSLTCPPLREVVSRYAVATTFLALVATGEVVTASLSPHQVAVLQLWASTNLANLQHHPIPALVLSAFLPQGSLLVWLAIIPLAMFGANRVLGNLRLTLVCAAGHLIGTGVSEGVVAYRVDHRQLPETWTHIIDIGPSYVVVSAIVVAVVLGSWAARIAALVDFAALVFIGNIFAGLTSLDVAPVGHLTAVIVAGVLSLAVAPGMTSVNPPDSQARPALPWSFTVGAGLTARQQ